MGKAIVYVDGFNLYYGINDRNIPHAKWLDLKMFYSGLFPDFDIVKIKYFSSLVGDAAKARRQRVYWNAIRVFNNIEVVEGVFQEKRVKYPRADTKQLVEIIKCTEKQTDVNIACNLVLDAAVSAPDVENFVLSSVDSDYTFPVNYIKNVLGKKIHIVSTQKFLNSSLRDISTSFKVVKNIELESARLPDKIPCGNGAICCPKEWR